MGEEEIKSLLPVNLELFSKGECANKQKSESLDQRLLIVSFLVMLFTAGVIDF